MNKELENLIKELNNGKLFGAISNIAKWLNISHEKNVEAISTVNIPLKIDK